MPPAQWKFWQHFNQCGGNVQRSIPLLSLGVNPPTNLQYSRVTTTLRGDLLQFLVGFDMIAQFDPAFSGLQVALVFEGEFFHLGLRVESKDGLGVAEGSALSLKPQRARGGGLKSAAYFRLVGIPRRIRALIHEDVDDLFQRINPCLRAVSAAMTKTAG